MVKQLKQVCLTGDAMGKEGELFAIELLCKCLWLLFEPCTIALLLLLLKAFNDLNSHVRTAAINTVGVIMLKLLVHEVKLPMHIIWSDCRPHCVTHF